MEESTDDTPDDRWLDDVLYSMLRRIRFRLDCGEVVKAIKADLMAELPALTKTISADTRPLATQFLKSYESQVDGAIAHVMKGRRTWAAPKTHELSRDQGRRRRAAAFPVDRR